MGSRKLRKQYMEQGARVWVKYSGWWGKGKGDLLSTWGSGIILGSGVHCSTHSQLPAQTGSPALPVPVCEPPGPGMWAELPFPVPRAKAHGWTGDSGGDWQWLRHPVGCPQGNCATGENKAVELLLGKGVGENIARALPASPTLGCGLSWRPQWEL